MPLIDRIKSHAAHVANLTYGPSGDGHRFMVVPITPPLTEQRCVYFLLSHNDTQIQKVGLANGIRGLSQRMEGYERIYRLDGPTGDPTMALWHRMMTGPLQGETLSLWFTSLSATTAVEVLGENMTLSWDPHREVERILAGEARTSGQPLLLSRSQAIGVQPGWLMGPLPLFSKALAQGFLSSRVVFYPGSGVDYAPMELFKLEAHGYLYVDYQTDLDSTPPIPNCILLHQQALTIGEITESLGLDPNQAAFSREDLTPNETQALDHFFAGQETPQSRLLGGRWSVWERNEILAGETHHRRFALLQLHAEAVWVFKGLWCTRQPQAKLFALYCGRDSPRWTTWRPGGWLFRLAVNHQAFPLWLRCRSDSRWPEYDHQFSDSPDEGTGVYRRTEDPERLIPMQLFLRARDELQGSLLADEEMQLAAPEVPQADKFWFRRYGRFLRDNHPEAFAQWETRAFELWLAIITDNPNAWLDFPDSLDDDASRWQ